MSDRHKSRRRPTPRRAFSPSLCSVLADGIGRRTLLKGFVAASALAPTLGLRSALAASLSSATFAELGRFRDEHDHWPEGYSRQILLRWGDPMFPDAQPLDPGALSGETAARQFGINNDFTAYLPLPWGSDSSTSGLLVVSHEYATPFLMVDGVTEDDFHDALGDEQIRAMMAATGLSVIEVRREAEGWRTVLDSPYNRRIHLSTEIALSGPAAGDARLRTAADPSGTRVLGTISNCNGGVTPWGTVLSGEEGGMDVFAGDYGVLPDQALVERQGWDEEDNDAYAAGRVEPRLHYENEPNEWMRFDWVVEVDPFDPEAMPVKRTALGRFTHEGAQVAVAPDGRVVVYMADDDDFEYLYRFVTRDPWNPDDRAANRDLLDHGTLSVARFSDDGTVTWLPLVQGDGPLTPQNGFASQADVVLNTRAAADLVGATPMDAPEGFIPHPLTGKLYVAMTENEDRMPAGEGDAGEEVDPANPRGPNPDGHILELVPPGAPAAADHAADTFDWDVFVLCGNPADPAAGALMHPETTETGWFTDPDNMAVDPAGRLWVCTDGPPPEGLADALYVMDTEGEGRALPRLFYVPPVGAEVCSPAFTPDGRAMFLSVQHPGELRLEDNEDATQVAEAGTRWPDFADGMPARSSLVVLTRDDGGPVGA